MTQIFSEGTIPTRTIAGGGARTHTILRSLDFESSASASSATPAKRIVKLRCQRRSSSAYNEIKRLHAPRRAVSKPPDSQTQKIPFDPIVSGDGWTRCFVAEMEKVSAPLRH